MPKIYFQLKKVFTFTIILLFASSVFAQNPLDVSFEYQTYPTGQMPGVQISKGFNKNNAVHLRIGYNRVRHGNAGVHDDERGGGWGFTFGYRKYFREEFQGFLVGVRNDFWFNKLDWKDNPGEEEEIKGTAEIIVIQPTAQVGYLWKFGSDWIISPTAALGYEINLGEGEGEDVGEGMIVLFGIEFGKRF